MQRKIEWNYKNRKTHKKQKSLEFLQHNKFRDRKLSDKEIQKISYRIIEHIQNKITPLKQRSKKKVQKLSIFPSNKNPISQRVTRNKSEGQLNKNRTQSVNVPFEEININQRKNEVTLVRCSLVQNGITQKQSQQFVLNQKISKIYFRANQYIQQSKKKLRKNISSERKTHNKKKDHWFSDAFQVINQQRKNAENIIVPKICYIKSEQKKNEQKQDYGIINPQTFKNLQQKQNCHDLIDKQFEEGLVEQIYAPQRVKLRMKINKRQWQKRQSNYGKKYENMT